MNNYKGCAKAVIVSSDIYTESVQTLTEAGVEVIFGFENKNVSPALSRHVDMQLVRLSDRTFVCAPESYEYYLDILKKYDLCLLKGNTYLSSNYPGDIAYNITVTEKFAVHNFKHTDSILRENLGYRFSVNVSQGYTGCTLCKIGDNAFITSDDGIFCALTKHDCHVLRITPGNISLPGFDYGFIGGSAFLLADDCLAVNGALESHPDGERIHCFCGNHGVRVLSLSDKPIMDIGSAVVVS